MKLRYTDRAVIDLEVAFDWYEKQVPGLGLDFIDCVEEKISTVVELPYSCPAHHKDFRRALIRKFPFSIFDTIENETIIVHAVFDNRRSPAHLP